jgi:hypothetical protein
MNSHSTSASLRKAIVDQSKLHSLHSASHSSEVLRPIRKAVKMVSTSAMGPYVQQLKRCTGNDSKESTNFVDDAPSTEAASSAHDGDGARFACFGEPTCGCKKWTCSVCNG